MQSRSRWIAAVVLVGVGAALVWAFRPAAVPVELARAQRGTFVAEIADDGVTRVRDRYVITAPVSGQLLRPEVRAGDPVRRDQRVATILPNLPEMLDPRTRAELAARREAAAARVARANAVVRQSETEVRQLELDAQRLRALAPQGLVAKSELDRAELSLNAGTSSLEAARNEADAAMHEYQQARTAAQLGQPQRAPGSERAAAWQIHSPTAGQVLNVANESGGPVSIGSPILTVGDVTHLEAVIDVLSSEAIRIPPHAQVSLDAGRGFVLSGRVRTVEPAATTKISALGVEEQRVNVVVDLLPLPGGVGPVGDNFRVDARIEVARIQDALQVPVASLFREGGRWAVFIVSGGIAHRRPVQIGLRSGERAVVTGGIQPGELVVVYPSDTLTDGARVQTSAARP
jgi:HlyD family secretion protein